MNCEQYRSMLATVPIEEMSVGGAREHAAGCHECNRVTRVVAEREHNVIMAFDNVQSPIPASRAAASALVSSRRRTVSLLYRIGLGIATMAMIGALLWSRAVPTPPAVPTIRETFRLQCLSPEQAAELLRPHMGRTGSITIQNGSPLGIINVAGPEDVMTVVRSTLDRYDSPKQSQCTVQVKVPKEP